MMESLIASLPSIVICPEAVSIPVNTDNIGTTSTTPLLLTGYISGAIIYEYFVSKKHNRTAESIAH